MLEASNRIGGRLKTLDHLDGAPECGGQTIGPMYARVLKLLDRFGLSYFERKPILPGNAYYIRGKLYANASEIAAADTPLHDYEKEIPPNRLYSHYLKKVNPLESLYDWRSQSVLAYDETSIAERFHGAGASHEAMRLMERWFDGGGMDNMSALFAFRKYEAARIEKKQFRIKGGSSRLPLAMAAGLKSEPRMNSPVAAISYDDQGAKVVTEDGSSFLARHVFFSAPFSVLRNIALDPAPPQRQSLAIEKLPYNSITQVKLAFSHPFWEADELPPSMYADSIVERVTATPGQDGALHYLNVWIKGVNAAEMDQYSEAEIGQRVVEEFQRLRPAA